MTRPRSSPAFRLRAKMVHLDVCHGYYRPERATTPADSRRELKVLSFTRRARLNCACFRRRTQLFRLRRAYCGRVLTLPFTAEVDLIWWRRIFVKHDENTKGRIRLDKPVDNEARSQDPDDDRTGRQRVSGTANTPHSRDRLRPAGEETLKVSEVGEVDVAVRVLVGGGERERVAAGVGDSRAGRALRE